MPVLRTFPNRYTSTSLVVLLMGLALPPQLRAASHDCTVLNVPGVATGINNAGVIVGSGGGHGFIRDAAGNVATVDYPGTTSNTQLFAINNHGVITGQSGTVFFTVDLAGNFKTLTIPPPYAGHTPSIYGINDDNAILGSSIDPPGSNRAVMFILRPDGTATDVSGPSAAAGSLNNAYQYLASSAPHTRFELVTTQLVEPSGMATPIAWVGPGKYFATYAFGLNNGGVVVGYVGTNPTNYPFGASPWAGFVRDQSGIFSGMNCAGLDEVIPNAINDNGVIVGSYTGGSFMATPVPGIPQIQFSTASLILPPTTGFQPSAPGSFTVTNTGDARLDIGSPHLVGPLPPFGPSDFRASACTNQDRPVVSLNPGESCIVNVIAVPPTFFTGLIDDKLYFDDSSSGSPHALAVSVTVIPPPEPPPPPSCQLAGLATGPPRQATFAVQDTTSGVASIAAPLSINVTLTIPPFTAGTTGPLSVTATQVDPTQPSTISLMVTNEAHRGTTCDASLSGFSRWTGLGGLFTSRVAAAVNAAGIEDAFVRGADDALWHITRTGLGEGWSDWQSFGGILTSDPVVAQNDVGRFEVFALGADHSLWHIAQNDPGSDWAGSWEGLGGILIGNPAVAVNADGRLEVFARGTDQALWHIWQTTPGGAWSQWHSLGGALVSNAAVGMNADGRLEAFAVGTDDGLWHIAQTAAGADWSQWDSLGGTVRGDPAVAGNADGRLEVFARGSDQALWHLWQTAPGGAWSRWSGLGGVIVTNPVPALNADGALEVFALGTDNSLWHIRQVYAGGDWSWWGTLAGGLADQPAVVQTSFQSLLEVLVRGTDNRLYTIQQSSAGEWAAGN